ncbi:MAG TPA: glutamine amidotransferase [Pseudonocardiaceae bacterium]|jgi:CobQ-like glutamine amidotransferase family enzyme|nr:glutamine amidotransferase [Pseudonocardiaceae bacterium]
MGDSTMDIGLVFPDLLGTYGDGGNAEILAARLRWRNIPARVVPISMTEPVPMSLPLYVVGGGEDAAQELAVRHLAPLGAAAARGAYVFAVCAGLQLLGRRFAAADHTEHLGLGLLDLHTVAAPQRAIGEITTDPCLPGLDEPLTGFENHQGHTVLGPLARPLGRVTGGTGNGDGTEGVVQERVMGTYLHGPVLARNPHLADLLLAQVLGCTLPPLDLPCVTALRRHRLAEHSRGRHFRHRQ